MLMVSGIGPKDTLSQFNIEVLSDLPGVGQNMWVRTNCPTPLMFRPLTRAQDHFFFGPSYQVSVPTHSQLGNAVFAADAALEYRANATGILTNTGADIFGWQKIPDPQRGELTQATRDALAAFPPDWPELEYIPLDAYLGKQLNYVRDAPKTPFDYVSPVVALVVSVLSLLRVSYVFASELTCAGDRAPSRAATSP